MLNYNIIFYVRTNRVQQNGTVPIYLRLWIGKEKLEMSTNQYVVTQNWDKKKQTAIKCDEAQLINSILTNTKTEVLQAITNLQLSKAEVSIDNVRTLLKGEQVIENYTLLKIVNEHNINFEKQVGTLYSYGSYKNYKTTYSFLKEFIQFQYHKHDYQLKQVNARFCESFFIWLTTKKTCKQNGAAKHIQRLKKVLNYAIRMGYLSTNPSSAYSIKMKSVPKVALSWDEVVIIKELLLQTDKLRTVRDIFIFQVFTGLAYSDVKAFCANHLWKAFDSKQWIRMERTKTRNTFTVPLLPPAIEILKNYLTTELEPDEPIFPVMSNQKMNYNLKIIQEIAGINKSLHTHLPRHTFATTITLMNGVPIETVSKMLGHTKLTMTQTYAKVGELKIAGDMSVLHEKFKAG